MQGDQIGRIFAYWAIDYLGKITQVAPNLVATFCHGKICVLIFKKGVGLHSGRVFTNSSGHPASMVTVATSAPGTGHLNFETNNQKNLVVNQTAVADSSMFHPKNGQLEFVRFKFVRFKFVRFKFVQFKFVRFKFVRFKFVLVQFEFVWLKLITLQIDWLLTNRPNQCCLTQDSPTPYNI
jgi:hypothetical protein